MYVCVFTLQAPSRGIRPGSVHQAWLRYMFLDPFTDEEKETSYPVPGAAWDSVLGGPILVLTQAPHEPGYVLCDSSEHPRRGKSHIRACTPAELRQFNWPGQDRQLCMGDIDKYEEFLRLHAKASKMARNPPTQVSTSLL